MDALPWIVAGFSICGLLLAVLIFGLEVHFAYWKIDEPKMRGWLVKKIQGSNRRIQIVWSPFAVIQLDEFIDVLLEKSITVPVDIVFGPAADSLGDWHRRLTMSHRPPLLRYAILEADPGREFAVFDGLHAASITTGVIERPENTKFRIIEQFPLRVKSYVAEFERDWEPLLVGEGGHTRGLKVTDSHHRDENWTP